MGYGPGEWVAVKNRHRWTTIDNTGRLPHEWEVGTRCPDCGIVRTIHGWRRHAQEAWRRDGVPRCGERRT